VSAKKTQTQLALEEMAWVVLRHAVDLRLAPFMRDYKAGRRARMGGIRGAEKVSGTQDARQALHAWARERYNYHYASAPDATRKDLCGAVAEDLAAKYGIDVTWRTVARWVQNPKPTRRGRPQKS